MPKTVRSYVSGHVYRTQRGLWYDDRSGKRLTSRRGAAAGRANERMKARVRDQQGRLGFKRLKVNSDTRKQGTKHIGSPGNDDFEVDSIYDPEISENASELASRYVEKKLDQEDAEYNHFNIKFTGSVEESEEITA